MKIEHFRTIDINDPFFDSLKNGYDEFPVWFERKAIANEIAYVQREENAPHKIIGFLYLKVEKGILDDIEPIRGDAKRLKVGTFKVLPHGTRFGERFVKKIVDAAIIEEVREIYVTVFDEHDGLIGLLEKYGFEKAGVKNTPNGEELVLVKDMKYIKDDILLDYPLVQTKEKRKFGLSIYPVYHTRLFPDSILNNESYDLIQDVSHTNSIHKVYLCYMSGTSQLIPGDLLAIYRTGDGQGPARYRSVVTSVCVVEEVKTKNDFVSFDEFYKYTNVYSIFDDLDLKTIYSTKKNLVVIRMTYNIAMTRRVTNGTLIDDLGMNPDYWGFFRFSDEQFDKLLEIGEIYENIIIN